MNKIVNNKIKSITVNVKFKDEKMNRATKMKDIGVTHWLNDFKELERITNIVSINTGISIDELKAKTRERRVLYPRQIAMYFAMKTGELTNHYVGEYFNRDHSTVINSVWQVQDLMDTNNLFRKKVEEIGRLINDKTYEWKPESIDKNLDDYKAIQNEQ